MKTRREFLQAAAAAALPLVALPIVNAKSADHHAYTIPGVEKVPEASSEPSYLRPLTVTGVRRWMSHVSYLHCVKPALHIEVRSAADVITSRLRAATKVPWRWQHWSTVRDAVQDCLLVGNTFLEPCRLDFLEVYSWRSMEINYITFTTGVHFHYSVRWCGVLGRTVDVTHIRLRPGTIVGGWGLPTIEPWNKKQMEWVAQEERLVDCFHLLGAFDQFKNFLDGLVEKEHKCNA